MLLLLLALDDDDRALAEQLWNKYRNNIYRIAFSLLRNRERSEDVQMDVISRVIKNIGFFKNLPPADVEALIYTYTRNAAINEAKKRKFEISVDDFYEDVDFPDISETENGVIMREQAEIVMKMISRLPEKYASVLSLTYVLGYTPQKIGKALGISPQNAYLTLSRAKKRLQKEYEKYLGKINTEKEEK